MRRSLRFGLIVAALAVLVGAVPAQAAAPTGGTISKTKQALTWAGQVYNYAIPYPDSSMFCLDNQCDHFKLKVNMGDGARIKVTITATSTPVDSLQNFAGQGVAPNDFDLYVYNANGVLVGSSGTPKGTESLTFTHKGSFRNREYDVKVSPWLVLPGATYTGTVTTVKLVK